MRTEFLLPQNIPLAQKLRCMLLNKLDNWSARLGANLHVPGKDLTNERAYRQFRNFKDVFDLTFENPTGYRTPCSSTVGSDYFDYMLPGIDYDILHQKEYRAIDPEQVIGCSWRNYPVPGNPLEIMEKLNSAPRGDSNRAIYIQIEDLPLFIASEGQNRVELFRRHQQLINASIKKLTITRRPVIMRNIAGDRWLATWPNKFSVTIIATVPFPTISLPIYRALGVEIQSTRLPVDENDVQRSYENSIEGLAGAVGIP